MTFANTIIMPHRFYRAGLHPEPSVWCPDDQIYVVDECGNVHYFRYEGVNLSSTGEPVGDGAARPAGEPAPLPDRHFIPFGEHTHSVRGITCLCGPTLGTTNDLPSVIHKPMTDPGAFMTRVKGWFGRRP